MLVPFPNMNIFSNTASKYPTNINKYECQKGPFEGFFVSSVEFCKHVKLDDKNDRKDSRDNNLTATQGPIGPQGIIAPQGPPAGATGLVDPQGPSDITQLNATNI